MHDSDDFNQINNIIYKFQKVLKNIDDNNNNEEIKNYQHYMYVVIYILPLMK